MSDPVKVYRPDSEEGRKAAACRNALDKFAEHVGFSTFMNAVLCVLAAYQNQATDAEYEHFVSMIGKQLRNQRQVDQNTATHEKGTMQ